MGGRANAHQGEGGGRLEPTGRGGGGGNSRWLAWRHLSVCWALALVIHIVWVPNLVWFLVSPSTHARSVIVVTAVGVPLETEVARTAGGGPQRALEPEIELPGMAPGGSASELAPPRHEWAQGAADQRQSWAPRAPDWAVSLQVQRPQAPGLRPRTPAEIVAQMQPGDDDLWLDGAGELNDSVLRRQGERADDPGAAGVPSAGTQMEPGEGPLAIESAGGDGDGTGERVAMRGGRPRQARPHVAQGPTAADAELIGDLAGMQASRQAAPEMAWSSSPVREARRASGEGPESDALAGGEVRRPGGQGAGHEARGPGGGGRGRGTRGTGTGMSPRFNSYLRDCIARISRQWSYPPELAYDLQQDLVQLEIRIRHDGRVEQVTVERSSGFEAFDATAVRAVRLASPLAPPPPEELFRHGRNYVVLRLSMRYRNPMFE